jgi:hypothetical protein
VSLQASERMWTLAPLWPDMLDEEPICMLPVKHHTLLSKYTKGALAESSVDKAGSIKGAVMDACTAAPGREPWCATDINAQALSMKPAPGKSTRPITLWSQIHCRLGRINWLYVHT